MLQFHFYSVVVGRGQPDYLRKKVRSVGKDGVIEAELHFLFKHQGYVQSAETLVKTN